MNKQTAIEELIQEFEELKKTKLYKDSFKAIDDCIFLAYNKLPKQKETIIDWSRVPDGYDWVTINKNNYMYCWLEEPFILDGIWNSYTIIGPLLHPSIIKNAPSDWKLCKFKRP